jgi:hypothetical protein
MPVPIMRVPDDHKNNGTSMDYSFLATEPSIQKKTVTASNKDASLLFELWENGEKSDRDAIKIKPSPNVTSSDILRLKTLGFLTGDINTVQFTRKGKMVVTTMSLGETNQFEKKRQNKSYTEILASMNKRGKKGYRIASAEEKHNPKFAVNNTNHLDLSKLFKK